MTDITMNDEMREQLKERPWLEPFVEPDDVDLEPAEARWREAVEEAHRMARTPEVVSD
jgi:hypothetical protein